ncbi:MAG: histidinol-phosphate transaminase [Gammaproteobacteria bacterium]|nr:histidinol-phosphate transaminase [Gammaproteobacteria bacterium]
MSCDFFELAAPGVRGLRPYSPGKPVEELEREYGIRNAVKLASNENPLGPDIRVLEALRANCSMDAMARYPDGSGFELKRALARKHGVEAAAITLGNGSNDVLELIVRAFVTPSHAVMFSQYAFAVYFLAARAAGARPVAVPAKCFGHDLEAMRAAITDDTRVVFIANPNNPTGTWVNKRELKAFLDAIPENVLVVADEAYIEYVEDPAYPDCVAWLSDYPNLIVSRTFSKAYGLAGLRVGYTLSHPDVANLLNRVRQPFNVNSFALLAAQTALSNPAHLAQVVKLNRAGREQLTAAFDAMGLAYIPSPANFICVDTGQSGAAVYESLLHEGVIVRPIDNYGLPTHLRVTMGLEQENALFIRALKKVLAFLETTKYAKHAKI